MISTPAIAATLPPKIRKDIGIQALSRSIPIARIARENQTSRKFVYEQKAIAAQALDESFLGDKGDDEVLFYLPITKTWLFQLILALVLICHSSYRGVVELLRDLFDWSISLGTVRNRLEVAAAKAEEINQSQDLSTIKQGLHDEIFQGSLPVLAGVDASSTYCYLLKAAEHRDEDTWGWYLLELQSQGFDPDFTIADAAKGLRAGQKAVMPSTPCNGDVFHILHQFEELVLSLTRKANGATTSRMKLEEDIAKAHLAQESTRSLTSKWVHLKRREQRLLGLAKDVKILFQWMAHDVLELAGPLLSVRQELFDFIKIELKQRDDGEFPMLRKLWKALHNQRDQLLAFSGVLDQKLAEIAERLEVSLAKVRDVCLLHRKQPTSNAYWEKWNQLYRGLSGKFHLLMEAVTEALKQTPRASSLVENLNSRLRNYFFLRRTLGNSYLGLLQYFLNHRCFMRSEVPEREGKSPKELLTGEPHPHWLELLGFKRFQRA
ncbi:hypothetical protein [Acaryochloris marina]|uniref:Transposase n=1 Tax=Acaryochloris marina (strain MBIC 11017) TaxID=329726 RepID=A8ZLJ6_ACAM1|nr:hypothetical protein [Acaryochloris marina]ABW32023.1 hypothetical protein AM1_B0304 [Acaryochloris marina MBIC11017]BDM81604.1 hypothetical protein AM10699_44710 [Acaryochloris marina MBIC10699]BDM83165.1 hypothetical protein AM10699_60260 [Acaryochloris marina MBIC10699]